MDEQPIPAEKFQWKWVGITFGLYVLFYLVPIMIVGQVSSGSHMSRGAELFVGGWSFAGIIILSAIAGYFSKGVTIWEPAIAGLLAVFLWFILLLMSFMQRGTELSMKFIPYLVGMMLVVFLLSLFGAMAGERLQESRKKNKSAV